LTLSQRPTLLAHIQRQSATEFALDQNREVFENARMDVGATQDMRCPRAYQAYAFLAIRLALSVG